MPAEKDKLCAAAVRIDGQLRAYLSSNAGNCCYGIPRRYEPIRGRAARVDGEARFPGVTASTAWSAELAPDTELAPEVRARLAAAWTTAARMEHASIAAFANLSLRLLALGAPPELVAATHTAALDEIEHARLAFQLASAYAGTPIAPAPFADAARMSITMDLAELARETLLDGCINETVAAFEAELASDTAADPCVAHTLRRIADDEKRHAQLAWQILAWCVRTSPRPLLADLRAALPVTTTTTATGPDLAIHGVLSDDTLANLRSDVLRDVVAPCLEALA
jgi:hypothetical protein